jgi:hypothetical protein
MKTLALILLLAPAVGGAWDTYEQNEVANEIRALRQDLQMRDQQRQLDWSVQQGMRDAQEVHRQASQPRPLKDLVPRLGTQFLD